MKILTFDLEDWFHILDHPETSDIGSWAGFEERVIGNTKRVMELLDRKKQKATFFCLGWIAEKYPSLIRELSNRGHEIASHSYGHQLIYLQSRNEFKEDLYRSISILESITGKKITAYRAPGFSLTPESPWVFEMLVEAGITHDCSIFSANRAHGGFPGAPSKPFIFESNGGEIKAFPMNTYSFLGLNLIFSGGGYFRLLNYALIKQMMRKSDYVMTYFHPRDFDILQPVIQDLSIKRRFKSYIGLKDSFLKLENLINDFDFCNLEAADKIIPYSKYDRYSNF